MDVGSVRMTERHLHDDPPTAAQIEAVVRDVHQALDEAATHVPWQEAEQLVGVAGTITTVAALALGLDRYRPDAVHGSRIGLDRRSPRSPTVCWRSTTPAAPRSAPSIPGAST